ncbi:MAG: heavy metal-associated domain-containing protein [Candidatus Marinimicrobia bacterium]|nr:heavy metal-associated domain-containing protein [Candidatus Neomarinimicrobiota bacterium]
MKTFLSISIFALLVGCSVPGSASGNANVSAVKIGLPTAQCGMCQQTIQEGLEALDGVQLAYVNLNEAKVMIKYNRTKLDVSDLEQTISKTGYQASDVPADENAYSKLPTCCKLPKDQ